MEIAMDNIGKAPTQAALLQVYTDICNDCKQYYKGKIEYIYDQLKKFDAADIRKNGFNKYEEIVFEDSIRLLKELLDE